MMPSTENHNKQTMTKVYGYSDDIVCIEGMTEDEIDCFEKVVELEFEDGTVVQVTYPKRPGLGVWGITYVKKGEAEQTLTECEDENADPYSDVLVIEAKLKSSMVLNREQTNEVGKLNYQLSCIERTLANLRMHNFEPTGVVVPTDTAQAMKRNAGIQTENSITVFGLPVIYGGNSIGVLVDVLK